MWNRNAILGQNDTEIYIINSIVIIWKTYRSLPNKIKI